MAIPVIVPKTAGLLTRRELCAYLQVGVNEIPRILERFGLEPVEGGFPSRSVWRQVLGVEPVDEDQERLLMQPLQDINWVARQVGRGVSTVRAKVRGGRFEYPAPIVDLGDPKKTSRMKRWVPEQILARKLGDAVPVFRAVEPLRRDDWPRSAPGDGPKSPAEAAANNAFAEMIRSNAGSPP